MTRVQKIEAVQAFVLSLSGQQLVTGVAVLVGGFINPCTISVAEFQVVMALAWFSSFTHLATLDVLRDYLRGNKVVRNWRIAGMLTVLALLIPAFSITLLAVESNQSLGCTCDLANNIPIIVASILVMSYLLTGYATRIINLLAESGSGDRSLIDILTLLYLRFAVLNSAERRDILRTARLSRQYEKLGPHAYASHSQLSRWRYYLRTYPYHYNQSFLARIGALVFYLSFGITQVIAYTETVVNIFQPESSRMDFGQIVPLVLLLLPLLTAAEVIYSKSCMLPDAIGSELFANCVVEKQSLDSSSPTLASTPDPSGPNILPLFAIHVLSATFVGFALSSPVSEYSVYIEMLLTGSFLFILFQVAWTVGSMIELHSMWKHVVKARKNKRLSGFTVPLLVPNITNSTAAAQPTNARTTTNVAASTSPTVPTAAPQISNV